MKQYATAYRGRPLSAADVNIIHRNFRYAGHIVINRTMYAQKNEEVISMSLLTQLMNRLFKSEKGQALSEYGLILALVAVVCIAILIVLGGNLVNILTQIANAL